MRVAPVDDVVPLDGVAQVLDVQVVLIGPEVEKWGVGLLAAQHAAGGCGSLIEGVVPVLDPQPLPQARVPPVGDVPRGKDVGQAGPAVFVYEDAVIDLNPRAIDQPGLGSDANAYHHQVTIDGGPGAGDDPLCPTVALNLRYALGQAQVNPVAAVDAGVYLAQLIAQDVAQGHGLYLQQGDIQPFHPE